jgi:hypothetical protein
LLSYLNEADYNGAKLEVAPPTFMLSALPVAVEAKDGADTVLGVDLDVPWLRQGQV